MRQDDEGTTAIAAKLYQVKLRSGRIWTGTKQELMETNPAWWPYAREVQGGDALELDFADDPHPGHLPSSSRRYYLPEAGGITYALQSQTLKRPVPSRRSATIDHVPQTKPQRQRRGWGIRAHPLLYLGVGMIFMLALWAGLQWLGSWWQLHQDDVTYGRPRTYQFDAVFGHSDSAANPTHIIIVNLNRHVIVIELPGGDPTHARIYSGPTLFGDGQDLTPVTGKAIDVNGDGKLDLVLFIQDQRIVFINGGSEFRPLRPGEHVTLPQ